MQHTLETDRLLLISCTPELLEQALAGDTALAAYLRVKVPENWTEFGAPALSYALDKLKGSDSDQNWWTYFPIHKQDNTLIGTYGYKGPPNARGEAEIGYEIAEAYRNKGLATELANALADNAFAAEEVTSVLAHTLGEPNASTKVLTKCGFQKTEVIEDEEEGTIWKWELKREPLSGRGSNSQAV